ncbi:MAG: adenylate/guanylate cyclase domain-containing protein [Jatrophihabitans sp.]|uniref:adenylate/guanylate cyclase domain-containing protein n=1 Tax=Jatrophihabitans sp. TaxID=1932789 RepID=UPI003F7D9AFF
MTALVVALALVAAALVAWAITAEVRLRRTRRELADARDQLAARRWVPSTRDAATALRAVTRTAVRVRDHGVTGALRSSIDDLAGWAQAERPDLALVRGPDGSVTIVFSDIEDSTALNERLGDRGWVRLLGRHDRIVRRIVDDAGGRVVKAQGDGFMLAFPTADDAVQAAVQMQQALSRQVRPPIRVRIGVHTGPAVHRDGDLFGRNVAYAARVAGCADGGEILVSSATGAALTTDLALDEGRQVELKGLAGPHTVHAVEWQRSA